MSYSTQFRQPPGVRRVHQMDGMLRLECRLCGWSTVLNPRKQIDNRGPAWQAAAAGHECAR